MDLYSVIAPLPGVNRQECDAFHHTVFHGTYRVSDRKLSSQMPTLGSEYTNPLHITRTGVRAPGIFKLAAALIVKHDLMEMLKTFPGVDFLQVRFDKLVDFVCEPGDQSYWKLPGFRPRLEDAPEAYLRSLPDCPDLHSSMGAYYEVICESYIRLMNANADYRPSSQIDIEIHPKSSRNASFKVDPRIFESHCIVLVPSAFIVWSSVYEIISEFLDPRFFLAKPVKL